MTLVLAATAWLISLVEAFFRWPQWWAVLFAAWAIFEWRAFRDEVSGFIYNQTTILWDLQTKLYVIQQHLEAIELQNHRPIGDHYWNER